MLRPKSHSQQVLQSTRFVLDSALHVRLANKSTFQSAAHRVLNHLNASPYSPPKWKTDHPLHPQVADTRAANFIFVMDLLNFSFWNNDALSPPFTVSYRDRNYTGYWSLVACMRRSLDHGMDITNPNVMQSLTLETCKHLFRSETSTEIPLLHQRLRVLQDAGKTLVDVFDGSFVNLVQQANHSCQSLIGLVLEHFPCFRDVSTYRGEQIYLYKRVQILVADLWACFEGKGLGTFHDINEITMFADYRVPQSLVYLGLIQYSPGLLEILNQKNHDLPNGDPIEVEIRSASIWAVELLRQSIHEELTTNQSAASDLSRHWGHGINAILLDFFLWDLAKQNAEAMQDIPIHCTRSIYY